MKLRSAAAFTLACVTLMLLTGTSFWSLRQIRDASQSGRHATVLMHNAAGLLSALIDAETGQLGYALTGDEALLQPFLLVRDGVAGRLQEMRASTEDHDAALHLDVLSPLVEEKMAELSRLVGLQRGAGLLAVRDRIRAGRDSQVMTVIRDEVRSFIQIEEAARTLQEDRFESALRILFTCIVSASLLFLYLMADLASRPRAPSQSHGDGRHLAKPA